VRGRGCITTIDLGGEEFGEMDISTEEDESFGVVAIHEGEETSTGTGEMHPSFNGRVGGKHL